MIIDAPEKHIPNENIQTNLERILEALDRFLAEQTIVVGGRFMPFTMEFPYLILHNDNFIGFKTVEGFTTNVLHFGFGAISLMYGVRVFSIEPHTRILKELKDLDDLED